VLRDYAEPGATRRMHSHDNVKWIVFTLVTPRMSFEGALSAGAVGHSQPPASAGRWQAEIWPRKSAGTEGCL
jgi:hypothetical protein